jgi:hypothetical protein
LIKLSLGIAVVSALLLLLQAPPEPGNEPGTGPFANSGQMLLAAIVVIMNILTGWYNNFMTDRREERKENALLKQREQDIAERREARLELERQLQQRAEDVKRDLDDARDRLEQKVDATAQKTDNITTLVDGARSKLLQEIADLKKVVASGSGTEADKQSAESAQQASDEQHRRVKEVEDKGKR